MNYDIMLSTLQENFTAMAGFNPDDASDIGIRLKVMAGEFLEIYNQLEFVKKQIFPQTATGEYLELHGKNRNILPIDSKKSKGKVLFSRQSPAPSNINIPAGTIVSCSSIPNSPFYVTDKDSFIPQNQTSVTVDVTATEGGTKSNLAANKIDTIVSSVPGVSSVSNPQPISGGTQKESSESLRKRILDSFINIPTAINLAFYEEFAMKYPTISSAKAINTNSSNIVELYVTNSFRNVPQNILSQILSDIEKFRPINTQVKVKAPENHLINCEIVVYANSALSKDETLNSAETQIRKYISELAIGEAFSPYNISSYILSIPSVVDYKFTTPTSPITISQNKIISPGSIIVTCEER